MNIKWEYLGAAILFTVQAVAAIAIGIALLLCPMFFLGMNCWIIYAIYGFIIVVAIIYSHITRGEYIEEVYTEGERIYNLISKYENKGMRVIDHRMFGYKARVYYNKETNTITLT